jgi:hypothetical protein
MKAALDAAGLSTANWTDAQRRECERLFGVIRKGRAGREERDALRELLRARLLLVGGARLDID